MFGSRWIAERLRGLFGKSTKDGAPKHLRVPALQILTLFHEDAEIKQMFNESEYVLNEVSKQFDKINHVLGMYEKTEGDDPSRYVMEGAINMIKQSLPDRVLSYEQASETYCTLDIEALERMSDALKVLDGIHLEIDRRIHNPEYAAEKAQNTFFDSAPADFNEAGKAQDYDNAVQKFSKNIRNFLANHNIQSFSHKQEQEAAMERIREEQMRHSGHDTSGNDWHI